MKLYEDSFWGRVRERMTAQGMNLRTLCERADLVYSTTTNQITLGKMPKKDGSVERMAQVLCTSVEYLTTGKGPDVVSEDPEISNLIADYLFLSEDKRKAVLAVVQALMGVQIENNRKVTDSAEKG